MRNPFSLPSILPKRLVQPGRAAAAAGITARLLEAAAADIREPLVYTSGHNFFPGSYPPARYAAAEASLSSCESGADITPEPPEKVPGGDDLTGKLMKLLIDLRAEARNKKDFATGDRIRNTLAEIGDVVAAGVASLKTFLVSSPDFAMSSSILFLSLIICLFAASDSFL